MCPVCRFVGQVSNVLTRTHEPGKRQDGFIFLAASLMIPLLVLAVGVEIDRGHNWWALGETLLVGINYLTVRRIWKENR